jgi:dTDP-4-amino-4,6-dideoxygalactose transaminase
LLTVGAVPVIVDVDPRTYALDTARWKPRLTARNAGDCARAFIRPSRADGGRFGPGAQAITARGGG